MKHLLLLTAGLVGIVAAAACGGGTPSASSPVGPTVTVNSSLTGSWVGTAADSTGTMMGAGMSPSMMGNMTWQITQTGNAFTGVMQFPGYSGRGSMTISGTLNGRTATFTMTMPNGSMMSGTCTATASGTFDLDDLMTQMHGTYAGTNSCGGPFDRGQMSMTRH